MKKSVSNLILFCSLMIVSLAAALQGHHAARLRSQLTEMYRGVLLSTVKQMDDMEHALEKALLSGSHENRILYLTDVSDSAGQALRSLSFLPLSHPDTMKAMKLNNQLGDYANALIGSGILTGNDAQQLSALIAACRNCTRMLYENQGLYLEKTIASSFYPAQDTETVDQSLSYPTLIYDGPFSDARQETPLPFDGEEISWEEAAQIAKNFVGENQVLSVTKGTDTYGPNPCHGITLTLKDITLEAAVTKKGGKVLWLTPDRGAFTPLCSLEQCRASAREFLQRNGFPEMESTFFQVYEGVMVIAFAAKEGDVLLYPDLVKVQLRMDTAQVVGAETKSFWQHHKQRSLPTAALSEQEARQRITPYLQVTGSRLCLIPKNEEEILCREISGTWQGKEYRVYLNAQTGEQEDLLQIVESSAGLEAV